MFDGFIVVLIDSLLGITQHQYALWRSISAPPQTSEIISATQRVGNSKVIPSVSIRLRYHLLLPQVRATTDHHRPPAHATTSQGRSPSVISLSDLESEAFTPSISISPHCLPGHATTSQGHSPSVISLSDSESEAFAPSVSIGLHRHPRLSGHATTSQARRSPSVISLTASDADTRILSPPPQPIVKWGGQGCVCSQGNSHKNPINVENVRIWPDNFHVCDIAQFIRLTCLPGCQQRLCKFFKEYFGMPYSPQTFRWTRSTWEFQENWMHHEESIDYGRLDEGLWSVFLTKVNRTF